MPRESLATAARHTLDAVLAITLAPRCVGCAQALDSPLTGAACPRCWSSIRPPSPPLCAACGDPLPSWRALSRELARCPRCRRVASMLAAARAAGDYTGALRNIIHAFKYEGRRTLSRPLGRLMRDAGAELLADADCVVPVPLHPWRQLRRGFNQARDLAKVLDVPIVDALWRRRSTASQTGLAAAARRRNVRDAFRLSPFLKGRTIQTHLTDRVVVLVDDVRTTGATLEACAHALKDVGAREVRALTAAHARLAGRSLDREAR